MNEGFLDNLLKQFAAMTTAQKTALGATFALSLAFFGWIASGAASGSERLLYRGVPQEEAAKVVDALSAERIAYRLDDEGTSIYVPSQDVHRARIRLAARGLPNGGGPGFELFEKSSFGVTDFVQRVNYRRALQGELARSIETLAPVDRARVQIALPEPSPFVGDRNRQPSASIVVQLVAGREFSPSQISGVVHLVASSVEGLDPLNVTLVDGAGRMLAPSGDGPFADGASGGGNVYETDLERSLGRRIEEILSRTVGLGRVVAHVNADLDWTRRETTEEKFDPNSQVERSEQRSTEESAEGVALAAGGVPGSGSNLPGGNGGGGGGGDSATSKQTTETINYEISKTVSHSVSSAAAIERLTVAILVDGKPGAEGGEFTPWSDEELGRFRELAMQAVGFNEQRGDTIMLTSAPFHTIQIEDEEGGFLSPELFPLVGQVLQGVLLLVALFLFATLVVRPLAAALVPPANAPLPEGVQEVLAKLAAGEPLDGGKAGGEGAGLRDQLAALTANAEGASVDTLRSWLRQS
ncbi:MAG: flagellar basal-body MS-ring/collar protein FliF [Myxococcota bacterium]|nr:flagellar M-ring protein FliF [Myxococcales bacterium]